MFKEENKKLMRDVMFYTWNEARGMFLILCVFSSYEAMQMIMINYFMFPSFRMPFHFLFFVTKFPEEILSNL